MKFSLMTTTMVFELLHDLQTGISKDIVIQKYEDMMKMISDLGISAVEITSMEVELFGLEVVKKVLAANKLAVGGFVHLDQFASVGEDKSKQMIAAAKARIDDAIELQADNVMLALMAQEDVTSYTQEELSEALIQNIAPIVEYGTQKGVKISVEDTPDIRLPLCDSADTKKLLDAIPDLYLTYDTGNMLLKHEDTVDYLTNFQDRICHVHLKDMIFVEGEQMGDVDIDGRKIAGCIHGQGMIDFKEVFALLDRYGYKEYAVIEYVGHQDHENHLKEIIAYLQGLIG